MMWAETRVSPSEDIALREGWGMVHSLLALSTSFFNRYGTAGRVLLPFQCFKHKRSLTPPRMSWSVCVCTDGAITT